VSLDYKVLAQAGLSLGSGVVLVLNEDRCIIDAVRNMARFFRHESCGKCTPCREGVKIIYNLLTKIALGKGEDNDLETLKSLGEIMKDASFCGLGQSAPNSLLDTLKLFTNEYVQHIQKKGCPLKACSY